MAHLGPEPIRIINEIAAKNPTQAVHMLDGVNLVAKKQYLLYEGRVHVAEGGPQGTRCVDALEDAREELLAVQAALTGGTPV